MTPAGWNLDGLVLDIDDTLYLERSYVVSGFRAVGAWLAEARGVNRLAETALRLFEEGVRGNIFNRALIELGVDPAADLVADLVNQYRCHEPDIELLPDAQALLDVSLLRGLPIAVITDGPAESQRAKVAALGIASVCDPVIVTSDHDGVRPKPDPSAFALIQERWGITPASLAYVGDNPLKDFIAPHQLGWRTVRVRRRQGLHEAVPSGTDVHLETRGLGAIRGLLRR